MGGGAAWGKAGSSNVLNGVAPCRAQLAAVPSARGRQNAPDPAAGRKSGDG